MTLLRYRLRSGAAGEKACQFDQSRMLSEPRNVRTGAVGGVAGRRLISGRQVWVRGTQMSLAVTD